MAEQLGLVGVFDVSSFNKGIGAYQKELNRAVGETNKASGSFGKSWNQMGQTVGNVAKTMGVAVVAAGAAATAAVVGFAASGVKSAMDLEAQMSGIAAILNKTKEEVAPLNDLILELGIDPNLKVSTMEAAQAIELLARNGLSMTEIMDGAARSTVLLANATGADFGTAADIATDAMAIFGIAVADMDEAVNGITSVTTASKFSIDDYRLALAQAGGVAGAVGVEFDDFNTTIAAISPSFASGSDAGTSFKTMLQRLIPQSTAAEDLMFELGLSATNYEKAAADLSKRLGEDVIPTAAGVSDAWFKLEKRQGTLTQSADKNAKSFQDWVKTYDENQFFDAISGDMKDMNEIAVLLNGALAGLTEEQKLQAVTVLAGADASRAMLGLMDAGTVVYTDAALAAKELGVSQDEVNKVIEGGITQFEALQLQMRQTDAAEAAATRMDNLAGAMEILSGIIETIKIRVGQAFIPALTEMTRVISTLIETHADGIVAFFQSFADNLVAVSKYIMAVLEDGDTMNDWLTHMSPAVADIVQKTTELAIALRDGLQTALEFVSEHADLFKGALIGIGAVLAAATITAGITAMAGAIASLFTPIGLIILAAAGLGIAWSTNWLGIRDTTLAAVAAIQEAFAPLTTAIQEFGSGALTEIQAFVTGNETEFANLTAIWDGAVESFGNVTAGIQEAAGGLVDYLKEQFPQLTPVFDGVAAAVTLLADQVQAQWTLLQDATSAMVELVKSLIDGDWAGAWQAAQDLAGAFVTYVETTFANLSEVFAEPLTAVTTLVGDTFGGLATTVGESLPGWQAQLGEWAAAAWQWITDAAGQLLTALGGWVLVLTTYIDANLETWKTSLAAWGTAAWEWIVEAATEVGAQMLIWGTAVLGYVTTNLPGWLTVLGTWGTAAWQWIQKAIATVTAQMATWGTAILGYVTTNLPTWISNLASWTKEAWQWIVNAAGPLLIALGGWLTALTGYLALSLPTWIDAFLDWTKAAWEWIVEAVKEIPGKLAEWYKALTDYLSPQLLIWKDAFVEWTKAAWQWIVDTVIEIPTKMAEWYKAISDWLTDNYQTFEDKAGEWSLGLYQWISGETTKTKTKEALDDWKDKSLFEKITAIDSALSIKMLDMGTHLYDWIGKSVPDMLSALTDWMIDLFKGVDPKDPEVNPELEAAKTRNEEAFQEMLDAIKLSVKENAVKIGKAVLDGFIEGINDWEPKTELGKWTKAIIEAVMSLFGIESPSTVFKGIGEDILQGMIDGLWAKVEAARQIIIDIRDAMIEKLTGVEALKKWLGVGADIVAGIGKGIIDAKDALLEKISELAGFIPQWMKDVLGIGSPAKVMIPIGVSIVDGVIAGLIKQENKLQVAVRRIANSVAATAGQAGRDASKAYLDALNKFSSVAVANFMNIKDEEGNFLLPGAELATKALGEQEKQLQFLKMQADLVAAIRESGADPSQVLAGIKLGRDADPVAIGRMVGETMRRLNEGLATSLQAVLSNADRVIEGLRAKRQNIADIEEKFTEKHISTLDQYTNRLAQIDTDLAGREARAIATGHPGLLTDVRQLDSIRREVTKQIEVLFKQRNQMTALLAKIPTSLGGQAQDAVDQFRKQFIDPLAESFETATIEGRSGILRAIRGYENTIHRFTESLPRIIEAEKQALAAAEGFGEDVTNRINIMIRNLYNPAHLGQKNVLIRDLANFARSLTRIRDEIEKGTRARRTGQEIIDQLTAGPKDLFATFTDVIADFDRKIEAAQNHALTTGDAMILNNIRLLDSQRGIAAQRLQELLSLRKNRQSIEDIEGKFTTHHLTTLERYAQRLEQIDTQIADAERQAVRTGSAQWIAMIRNLDTARRNLLAETETLFSQQQQLEKILAMQPMSTNQRGQEAIERWRTAIIDPLLKNFEQISIAGRATALNTVQERMNAIRAFAQNLPIIAAAEVRALSALEGFGAGAQQRIENMLSLLYDPHRAASVNQNLAALDNFSQALIRIRREIETNAGKRLTPEAMIQRLMGGFDQLEQYKNAIADLDAQISRAEAHVLHTGSEASLAAVRAIDATRQIRANELETFVRQSEQLASIMRTIKNLSGPGQASAERFLQEAIQPIVDAFSAPMRPQEREAWLRTAQERVTTINRFIDQMRAVEKLQARVAGNQFFAHLADEFAMLQDITLPEWARTNLINQLNSFITQMMRLQQIQQDITVGRGVNPIVERFASQRLDAIARQLENINLSEAQRNQLIEQYRVEQEKILRIQEKQHQLNIIQEQIALIKQLRDLDDQEGWSINVDSIISGIQFGINASIDDLMRLTDRVLSELIRFANHELGIASPSKVFAKVGSNIMAGLEEGILAGMRYPMSALRNATGNLVPYSLGQRSLAVNMGGVTINNGMDDVMFEARIRQIVRSEFG